MKKHSEAVYGNDHCPLNKINIPSLKEDTIVGKQGLSSWKDGTIYLHIFHWPGSRIIIGNIKNRIRAARLITTSKTVAYRQEEDRLILEDLPKKAPDPYDSVIALEIDGQPEAFDELPYRLPKTFVLGDDIPLPIEYSPFPTGFYGSPAAGMVHVPACRQGSTNNITHLYTNLELDYIFVSKALWDSPLGRPQGEIYHSGWDQPTGGLPKAGDALPEPTSLDASDHYVVFVDLQMEDE